MPVAALLPSRVRRLVGPARPRPPGRREWHMGAQAVLQREAIQVYDYRCSAGPGDRPFAELHEVHSLAYVRKGSFGYRVRGQTFELVAGSILVGRCGDEYVCTHDHHVCGDECLSIQLAPETVEAIGGAAGIWRVGALPPRPQLVESGQDRE